MSPEESYKILVDISMHHTDRLQHFNNINMAVHALIVTAIGYTIKGSGWHFENQLWVVPFVGFLLTLIWLLGLWMIRRDTDMRYAQLRALERIMGGSTTQSFPPEQQLFEEGHRFYFNREIRVRELLEVSRKWKPLGFINLFRIMAVILLLGYLIVLSVNFVRCV